MKYDGNNLKEVLESHKRWLAGSYQTKLSSSDKADFSRAYLRGINLSGEQLLCADFHDADLRGVGFIEADLSGAYMLSSVLHDANLCGANLVATNLRCAALNRANLCGADLSGAILSEADLSYADLSGVIINDETCFDGACLHKAKNPPYIPLACPDTGEFIAWKKCLDRRTSGWWGAKLYASVIVKLLIPKDAKRSSATGKKCRSDKAVVLGFESLDGKPLELDVAYSILCQTFEYRIGETVTPIMPFCEDRFNECASGIHFYVNRQDAVDY